MKKYNEYIGSQAEKKKTEKYIFTHKFPFFSTVLNGIALYHFEIHSLGWQSFTWNYFQMSLTIYFLSAQ